MRINISLINNVCLEGRLLVFLWNKTYFYCNRIITASFGYITATCDYIIKSCGFIIRACGYRFFAIKKHFILWKEKFPSDPKEFRLYKDNEKFLIYIIIIFKIQTDFEWALVIEENRYLLKASLPLEVCKLWWCC